MDRKYCFNCSLMKVFRYSDLEEYSEVSFDWVRDLIKEDMLVGKDLSLISIKVDEDTKVDLKHDQMLIYLPNMNREIRFVSDANLDENELVSIIVADEYYRTHISQLMNADFYYNHSDLSKDYVCVRSAIEVEGYEGDLYKETYSLGDFMEVFTECLIP